MHIPDLLGVLPLVLLREGLEAVHNDPGVVAVVHVDAWGTHPRLHQNKIIAELKVLSILLKLLYVYVQSFGFKT